MLVFICSLSIVISLLWKVAIQLDLLDILARQGYKYKEFKIFNKKDFILIIPILNLITMFSYQRKISSISNVNDSFLKDDTIELDLEEQEMYQKNKNFFTAFRINFSKKNLPKMILTYMEEGECNEIHFVQKENKYIVVSSKGKISTYSKKKQLNRLKTEMQEIEEHYSKVYSQAKGLDKKSFSI